MKLTITHSDDSTNEIELGDDFIEGLAVAYNFTALSFKNADKEKYVAAKMLGIFKTQAAKGLEQKLVDEQIDSIKAQAQASVNSAVVDSKPNA